MKPNLFNRRTILVWKVSFRQRIQWTRILVSWLKCPSMVIHLSQRLWSCNSRCHISITHQLWTASVEWWAKCFKFLFRRNNKSLKLFIISSSTLMTSMRTLMSSQIACRVSIPSRSKNISKKGNIRTLKKSCRESELPIWNLRVKTRWGCQLLSSMIDWRPKRHSIRSSFSQDFRPL